MKKTNKAKSKINNDAKSVKDRRKGVIDPIYQRLVKRGILPERRRSGGRAGKEIV